MTIAKILTLNVLDMLATKIIKAVSIEKYCNFH